MHPAEELDSDVGAIERKASSVDSDSDKKDSEASGGAFQSYKTGFQHV